METTLGERDFVDVGYVSNVHGLQGEIRVKLNTDFPELRFGKPGKRWLRLQFSGKERVLEVELTAGRGHPGDKSWIVKLSGFDSIDQAKELVGATFLARDRPKLEEGEFYSRDLVDMRVILKDTGEAVGTVVNVFNSGGNDLLDVMLHSSTNSTSEVGNQNSELPKSGQHVWIPFVEAIVPDVDLVRREMQITPPKGLLELNLRSDEKSKKERRLLDWRERKKFQRHLIAAKKKLYELEQQHVFHGFRYGEKSETNLLAEQIVSVNSILLQQALKAVEMPNNGYNGNRSKHDIITQNCESTLKILEKHLHPDKLEAYDEHRETGLKLISEGKVATVMLSSGKPVRSTDTVDGGFENWGSSMTTLVETLLSDLPRFVKVEQRASVPVILILPAHEIQPLEELFASHEYFGFSPEKVRFLEEENLPVVSCSAVEQKKNKVLMKSPYAILQSPLGSGGVITALSSYNILEDLIESGVEYVELCNFNKRCPFGNPILFGFVSSCETDIGIVSFEDEKEFKEDNFHIILSVKSMMKLMKQIEKLPLHPILKPNSHVELLNKKWVDVVPSAPNSYEFHCSIYDLLDACLADKTCLIEGDRKSVV